MGWLVPSDHGVFNEGITMVQMAVAWLLRARRSTSQVTRRRP